MKHGDLFVVRTRYRSSRTMNVYHYKNKDIAENYPPGDYFLVPINSCGIYLETSEGMHKILFPEYGTGWVYDAWFTQASCGQD